MKTPAATVEAQSVAADPGPTRSTNATRRRARAALGAAALAFLSAVVVAFGPADATRGDYRWPAARSTSAVPQSGAGSGLLFAPLLLSRHTPARLSVAAPCTVVRAASPANGDRLLILATANQPETAEGLWLVVEKEALKLGVGGTLLAEAPWPGIALDDSDCAVSARFRGDEWQLDVGGTEVGRGLTAAPVVTGLFTQLPQPTLGNSGLSVRVVTAVAGSSISVRQLVATVLAIGAGVAALVLLIRRPGSRTRSRRSVVANPPATSGICRIVRRLRWIDAVVLAALTVWWLFGPVLLDDGWVLSTVLNYRASGAFSNYYQFFDAQYPLGFLHDLLHITTASVGTSLLWMRLPVLAMGFATWILLRVYLERLREDPAGKGSAGARVALASVFLLFWFAWLSTLRPEPIVALLSVAALVSIQRFYRAATLGPLAVATLAATVAITLHPVGIVAVAPVLVAMPAIWRWARGRGSVGFLALVALGLTAGAAFVVLVMADTDLGRWRDSRHFFALSDTHQFTWRDEDFRYEMLFEAGSPVARRASLLFPLVAVALFLTRPLRGRKAEFDLPVISLVLGVVLMALTPSKWPVQLGALGGFAALAVATELHGLALERRDTDSRNWRSLLVLGLVVVASGIAWRGSAGFGPYTVREVEFGRGGSGLLGIDLSSPIVWLALGGATLVGCVIVAGTLLRRFPARSVLERWLALAGDWAVPGAVGVVLATTLTLFIADAFATAPAWSMPRQHYDDLSGHSCGLADDVGVANPAAGAPLQPDRLPAGEGAEDMLPDATRGERLDFTADGGPDEPAGTDLGTRWGSRVTGDDDTGVFSSPWFVVGPGVSSNEINGRGLALFTAGSPGKTGNLLLVQFGRREGESIRALPPELIDASNSDLTWKPSALAPPPGMDRVRVVAVDASQGPRGWLAFSVPRSVRYESLETVLGNPGATALISPFLRFYFPCATDPSVARGVAEAPDYVVGYTLLPHSALARMSNIYPSQPLLPRTSNGTVLGDLDLRRVDKKYIPAITVPFER